MKQKIRKRATSAIPIIAYEKEDIEPLVKELIDMKKTYQKLIFFNFRERTLSHLCFKKWTIISLDGNRISN